MTTKRIEGAETKLERHVQRWINSRAPDYPDTGAEGVLKDLSYGGCQSGMVGHLIYYYDTAKFYKRYAKDIDAIVAELVESTGEPIQTLINWDASDPLGRDTSNQNLLAWLGFEEAARALADRNEIEA